MKLFRLGAAPDAWDDTVNWAKSKDYDLALVEKAGLIIHESRDPGRQTRDPKLLRPISAGGSFSQSATSRAG